MDTAELTCQELVELVTDYLEGALPPEERLRFDAHLRDCHPCIAYIEQVRTTVGLLGRLTPETIEPLARDQLLDRFRTWRGSPQSAAPDS